eukprot:3843143-Pyramimonas_sp.AAC.1
MGRKICRTGDRQQQDTEQAHGVRRARGGSRLMVFDSQRQGREEDGWRPRGRNNSFVVLGEGYEGGLGAR